MCHRLLSTAAVLLVVLPTTPSPGAAQDGGPEIRGRLAEPIPAEASRTAVELFPLPDPHARALVELGRAPAPVAAARAEVRPDGTFSFAAPGPGPWVLRVTVPGHLPQERVLAPDFDVVELEPVPLVPAEQAPVAVLGPDGEPPAGARLESSGEIQIGWRSSAALNAAAGDGGRGVAFHPLEEGVGMPFTAWAPGLAESEMVWPRDSSPVTVTVPVAEPRRLELRDPAGRPVAGAVIRFEPGPGGRRPAPWPAGVTDERGRVEAALPTGAEAVRIETGRGWALSLPLPPACGDAGMPCRLGLPAPVEVAGEVRDAVSSRPLGGALVWWSHQPDRAVSTDGRGRFVLRSASGERPDRVLAEAAGFAAWSGGTPPEPPQPLLLALEPAMRIAGRVVDPEGVPLEGARIRLRLAGAREGWPPEPSGQEVVTASLAGGAFRLPDVAAKAGHRLRAELVGFAPAEVQPPPGAAGDLKIVLTPGGAVVGRLAGPAGELVPGGRVRVLSVPDTQGRAYRYAGGELVADAGSTAGDDGRFTIRNVAPGRYELLADHPDYATRLLPPFEVAEGETVDVGTIELAEGGRLAGRVVDPAGQPLEGVRLEAAPDSLGRWVGGFLFSAHATSDVDGHFELGGLPAGEPLRLTAHHSSYPVAKETGIVLPREEPIVVELRRGARVFGRVLGPRGEPIEGAMVSADIRVPYPDGSGSTSAGTGSDRTDADGGFEIEGLGEGLLHLTARADGYPAREVEGVTVGGDGHIGPIEIHLDVGAEVSGRVLAPDGSPVPGASVSVHTGSTPVDLGIDRPSLLARPDRPVPPSSAYARSDARGEFLVSGTALGPATIKAEHDRLGDVAAELVIAPGVNAIDLVLDPRGRVEGRVVDAERTPVAGAEVELARASDGGFGNRRTERTDPEGRFLFRWLTSGDYLLGASAPGLLLEGEPVAVTVASVPAPPVELVLTSGEEIAGRVLGVPNTELLRIRISAHAAGPARVSRTAVPGPDGRYRLTGLPPGRWIVTAFAETGRNARSEVEVDKGGGPYRLDLDVGGGLTLTGSVRLDGEPLAGASIAITGAGSGVRPPGGAYVETAFDGTFRAEGLEPGEYQLAVGMGGSVLGRRELTITGDDQIHLDLTAAAVSGRVVDAGGEPVAGASVIASVEGQPSPETMSGMTDTDSAGRFAFSHLAPGRYVVHAMFQGKPTASAAVSLEAGERRDVELRFESGFELVLIPSAPGGANPHLLMVMVFQQDGAMPVYASSTPVSADGAVVLPDVPAGRARLVVYAEGTAMVEAAAEVPGPPVTVVLPPPTVLEIEAPALAGAGLVPLAVTGPDGRPPAVLATGMAAQLIQGWARLELLPPGTWTVRAVGPDGREVRGAATTAPGPPARLVLE